MDQAGVPEDSSAASALPLLSKSVSEALAARDHLNSLADSLLPSLSESVLRALGVREYMNSLQDSLLPSLSDSLLQVSSARDHLNSLTSSLLPSLRDSLFHASGARGYMGSLTTSALPSPGVLDSVTSMLKPAVTHASLFTLPEVGVVSGAIDSLSKVLEPPALSANLFTLPELEVASSLIASVKEMLKPPSLPANLFTLPELDVTSGLISSVSKVFESAVMPVRVLELPELDVTSGLISSVNKVFESAVMPASLFTLPKLQLGLEQGPPLATEVPEEHDPLGGSGMDHLDEDLWIALSPLPSTFREMHWGAWEALVSGRPDSRRQSAHSARELIDWVLRTLAPNRAFAPEQVAREGYRGQPTRAMRVRWILRAREREFTDVIVTEVRSVHRKLSGIAHTGNASEQYLRRLLRWTEGLLLALTGPPQP